MFRTKNPNSSCGVDGAGGIGIPEKCIIIRLYVGEPGGSGGAPFNVALTLSFKCSLCFIVFSLVARSQSSGVCCLCVVGWVGEVSNDI